MNHSTSVDSGLKPYLKLRVFFQGMVRGKYFKGKWHLVIEGRGLEKFFKETICLLWFSLD